MEPFLNGLCFLLPKVKLAESTYIFDKGHCGERTANQKSGNLVSWGQEEKWESGNDKHRKISRKEPKKDLIPTPYPPTQSSTAKCLM